MHRRTGAYQWWVRLVGTRTRKKHNLAVSFPNECFLSQNKSIPTTARLPHFPSLLLLTSTFPLLNSIGKFSNFFQKLELCKEFLSYLQNSFSFSLNDCHYFRWDWHFELNLSNFSNLGFDPIINTYFFVLRL